MFKTNFKVIIEHDMVRMIEMIKKIESYGAKVYEINDEITSIILHCSANTWLLNKMMKDKLIQQCIC